MPASRSCSSRLLEQAGEDRDREVEVAVLLHVEVDELAACRRRRLLVERGEAVDDALDRLVEAPHREVARDRRDLDRDVVDVVAREQLAGAARRWSASPSPSTASPSRLMLRRDPSARSLCEGLAEALRASRRSRGGRPCGAAPSGRSARPARAAGCRCRRPARWRPAGTRAGSAAPSRDSRSRLRAATRRSSGRTTPSTNPRVKARPRGSFSTPARRSADLSGRMRELALSHRRTSSTVSSTVGRSGSADRADAGVGGTGCCT